MADRSPLQPLDRTDEPASCEQRFRRTFDDAPTPIALIGLDRRLEQINQAFCELFGYPEGELIGRTMDDITHPEDLARDLAAAREALDGERARYVTEKRYLHRDGTVLRVRLSASLVRDDAGAPGYFVSHYEDLTEARHAQDALSEARGLLEESQAAAHVGSWTYWFGTREIAWSDEQRRLHGLDPADGDPTIEQFLELLHPDDREGVRRALRSHSATPQAFQGGYRVVAPDGVRTLRVSADVLPADPLTGRPARISGTTWDVTAEREARRAQRAVEERHRGLLASLPDTMVVLYDRDLCCTLLQGRLVAQLGIEPEQYLGRALEDFLDESAAARIVPGVHRALAGETARIEYSDPHDRAFQVEFAPLYGAGEEIVGALTVWRDVTGRVAQEDENRLLAAMVHQSEDAIIAKDLDGTIVAWNAGAERLYGYPAEQAVGRSIGIIVPSERDGEDRELLGRVRAGEVTQRETTRRHRDGHRVEVSISVSPLRDSSGEITGALVIARDVGERIRTETARREAEDRLRVTVEHAPIGVALIDLRGDSLGRLVSVNDAFGALVDDAGSVTAGASLAGLAHPDDAPRLRSELARLSGGQPTRIETEIRVMGRDGSIGWLLLTGAQVPSLTGSPEFAVVHALDIGERKRLENRLQHLADHDPLTGMFNRRRFEQELARMVALVDRYAYSSALLVIDLDDFKRVNDTLGHSFGDELLTRVGAALHGALRETDVIGRLGGDEFAVVLGAADAGEALLVAEKLLREIERHGVVESGQVHMGVSASIGVAPFGQSSLRDAAALLVDADLAMYRAKEGGRNRIAVADRDGEDLRLALQRSWLDRLTRALERDQFELYAQPVRTICAPGPDGFELLLRLREDDGELISPAEFLLGAERFGLIQEIDRWVFTQALTLLSRYEAAGIPLQLSINMSGRTLCDPELIGDLRERFAACPIPRGRLVVEVTETAAIDNVERARTVARALRSLGCRFALDDFGTGFASFFYLKQLEFDYLKVDGEFVRNLAVNPTDQLVVRCVVELARGLGAEVVAEFVGDDATVRRLRELGVGYGQGYHLGRPAPLAEVLPALGSVPLLARQ